MVEQSLQIGALLERGIADPPPPWPLQRRRPVAGESPRGRSEETHPPLATPTLQVKDLALTYEHPVTGDRTQAVAGITLDVRPGEFVSVVGPSGCGKSSFLSAVAGLLRPASGSIAVDGKAVRGPGVDRALVFQKANLLPWRTVIDNVTYGLELRGLARRQARERARSYVRLVQLDGFEHFHPGALSGGMQQRVNLARALATEPALLLLDEPFAALDAITREEMQDELLSICASTRKTILMVTHQIDEAVLLSDRVIVLSDRPGRLVAEVPVPFARPRDAEIRHSARFGALTRQIWDLIHHNAGNGGGLRRERRRA